MSYQQNEIFLESQNDELQQALADGNWKLAHEIINYVEKEGFENEAYEMRRDLNEAQAQSFDSEDDIRYEPYEHPQPPVLEDGWKEEGSFREPEETYGQQQTRLAYEEGQHNGI